MLFFSTLLLLVLRILPRSRSRIGSIGYLFTSTCIPSGDITSTLHSHCSCRQDTVSGPRGVVSVPDASWRSPGWGLPVLPSNRDRWAARQGRRRGADRLVRRPSRGRGRYCRAGCVFPGRWADRHKRPREAHLRQRLVVQAGFEERPDQEVGKPQGADWHELLRRRAISFSQRMLPHGDRPQVGRVDDALQQGNSLVSRADAGQHGHGIGLLADRWASRHSWAGHRGTDGGCCPRSGRGRLVRRTAAKAARSAPSASRKMA